MKLQDALELRQTTDDFTRTEQENEALDHLIYEAARKYANLDYLAAAIGHGIDLQEATDIVDLALAGRENLSTFRRQLYDAAALSVTEDEQ